MPSHDPFSPESAAAPPTSGVKATGQITEPDYNVLQPDETEAPNVPAAPSPAPEAPQTADSAQSTNDAPTTTPDAQTPAEGDAQGAGEPPPYQAPEPEPATEELEVKVGTSKEVLDWVNEVDGDERTVRAQAALDAERASSEPRKGLSRELEELLGGSSN